MLRRTFVLALALLLALLVLAETPAVGAAAPALTLNTPEASR